MFDSYNSNSFTVNIDEKKEETNKSYFICFHAVMNTPQLQIY
jgi:hypothetical protein